MLFSASLTRASSTVAEGLVFLRHCALTEKSSTFVHFIPSRYYANTSSVQYLNILQFIVCLRLICNDRISQHLLGHLPPLENIARNAILKSIAGGSGMSTDKCPFSRDVKLVMTTVAMYSLLEGFPYGAAALLEVNRIHGRGRSYVHARSGDVCFLDAHTIRHYLGQGRPAHDDGMWRDPDCDWAYP